MTNRITESNIEEFAIKLLEKSGYQYVYGPDIAPDGKKPERQSFEDVLLIERLAAAVARINPNVPAGAREDAIKQLLRLNSPELISNNESFHRMLTEGIKVIYRKDGHDRGDKDVDDAINKAKQYGLSATSHGQDAADTTSDTGGGAAAGAASGAVAGQTGTAVGVGAAAGAAGGAAAGGTRIFFRWLFGSSQPSEPYRRFVNKTLAEKGYEVLGWE